MSEASRIGVFVVQANHGFGRGDPVLFDGSNWTLANTGGSGIGLVGSINDGNTFEFVTHGELEGLTGLEPGATYYAVSGALTTTPSGVSVGYALSDTKLFIQAGSSSSGTAAIDTSSFASTTQLAGAIAAEITRSNTAIDAAIDAEVARAEARYERFPTDADLTYTGDLLTLYEDEYGTKTFAYDVNDRMTGWTGTGIYRSCTLGYTGDLLTSKTYS